MELPGMSISLDTSDIIFQQKGPSPAVTAAPTPEATSRQSQGLPLDPSSASVKAGAGNTMSSSLLIDVTQTAMNAQNTVPDHFCSGNVIGGPAPDPVCRGAPTPVFVDPLDKSHPFNSHSLPAPQDRRTFNVTTSPKPPTPEAPSDYEQWSRSVTQQFLKHGCYHDELLGKSTARSGKRNTAQRNAPLGPDSSSAQQHPTRTMGQRPPNEETEENYFPSCFYAQIVSNLTVHQSVSHPGTPRGGGARGGGSGRGFGDSGPDSSAHGHRLRDSGRTQRAERVKPGEATPLPVAGASMDKWRLHSKASQGTLLRAHESGVGARAMQLNNELTDMLLMLKSGKRLGVELDLLKEEEEAKVKAEEEEIDYYLLEKERAGRLEAEFQDKERKLKRRQEDYVKLHQQQQPDHHHHSHQQTPAVAARGSGIGIGISAPAAGGGAQDRKPPLSQPWGGSGIIPVVEQEDSVMIDDDFDFAEPLPKTQTSAAPAARPILYEDDGEGMQGYGDDSFDIATPIKATNQSYTNSSIGSFHAPPVASAPAKKATSNNNKSTKPKASEGPTLTLTRRRR